MYSRSWWCCCCCCVVVVVVDNDLLAIKLYVCFTGAFVSVIGKRNHEQGTKLVLEVLQQPKLNKQVRNKSVNKRLVVCCYISAVSILLFATCLWFNNACEHWTLEFVLHFYCIFMIVWTENDYNVNLCNCIWKS